MFQWDKSINAVYVPANRVVSLFRSMRDVQLALPGVSAQQASAYLCQYQTEEGIATVAVFQLHKTSLLAFYYSDPRVVAEQKADSMLDQGLNFVESMGFLLTNQDLHLLDETDQEMLWASLPLQAGLPEQEASLPDAAAAKIPAERPPGKAALPRIATAAETSGESRAGVGVDHDFASKDTAAGPEQAIAQNELESAASVKVDDLLAAVEAMRAKRPGLRARKQSPSAEEMGRRRQQLRETIGRILASL